MQATLNPPPKPKDKWRDLIQKMSEISTSSYRKNITPNSEFIRYLKTSFLIIFELRLRIFNVLETCLIHLILFSTKVTSEPLDMNSKPIIPDPVNKSRTFRLLKSILFEIILNMLSFARLVVGRMGKFFGILMLLPLNFPEIIFIENYLTKHLTLEY